MKYLKSYKLFESTLSDNPEWNDYVSEFLDSGFNIEFKKFNTGETQITGVLKNKKLEVKDVHDWYSVMLNRFSDNSVVTFSQTYFNEVTTNYSFTIKISDSITDLESINIKVGRSIIEWIPTNVIYYIVGSRPQYPYTTLEPYTDFRVSGRLKNKASKQLWIRVFRNKPELIFGNRGTGIKIDKENLDKLSSLITSGQVQTNGVKFGEGLSTEDVVKFLNELPIK